MPRRLLKDHATPQQRFWIDRWEKIRHLQKGQISLSGKFGPNKEWQSVRILLNPHVGPKTVARYGSYGGGVTMDTIKRDVKNWQRRELRRKRNSVGQNI